MGSEWPVSELDDVCDDILDRRGVTPKKLGSDFTTSGHRVISAKLIKDHRVDMLADEARYIDAETYERWMPSSLEADDVLLTSEAPLGEVAYLHEDVDWALGQRLFAIRTTKEKLHGRFLFYALRTGETRHDLLSRATGSTASGIRQSELRKVKIPLPPLSVQRGISEVLGSLDDKIELNRRMNQTLESMARALFKSWFVDFDPVHANAAGEPSLPAALAALFPAEFEPSALGDIPAGWEVKPIGELCDINARTLRKADKLDQLEYVEISAANRGDIESLPRYNRDDAPGRARRRLQHGDVAVSTVRPDRGAYFLALDPPAHRIASTGFAVMTPGVPFSFLFVLMTRPAMSEKLGQLADGAAYPAIKPEQIAAIDVVVPGEPETLDAFHGIVEPLVQQMEQNRKESRILAAVRDALLPKLLGGDV